MNHYGDTHATSTNIKYCFDCKQGFFKVKDLRTHLSVVHNKDVPMESCLMCNEMFPTYKVAAYHMQKTHRNFKVICTNPIFLCNESFDTIEELKIHSNSHIIPDVLICPHCGENFKLHGVYLRHVKSHSMEKKLACTHCERKFFFEIELKNHIETDHFRKHQCDQCNYTAIRRYKLMNHIESVHLQIK